MDKVFVLIATCGQWEDYREHIIMVIPDKETADYVRNLCHNILCEYQEKLSNLEERYENELSEEAFDDSEAQCAVYDKQDRAFNRLTNKMWSEFAKILGNKDAAKDVPLEDDTSLHVQTVSFMKNNMTK